MLEQTEKAEIAFAARVLRRRAGVLLRHLSALRRRPGPDSIHDTRVHSRRMRAALEAFRDLFPASTWQESYDAARLVTRSLGRARESEVLLALVSEVVAGGDDAEIVSREYLEERFRTRLSKLTRRMNGELARIDTRALRLQFEGLVLKLDTPPAPSGRGRASSNPEPLPSVAGEGPPGRARRILSELSRPILAARGRGGFHRASDERLHRLRIQVKRLRYALEIFSEEWPGGLEKEIELARALQDAAGAHQDWAVLQNRLREEIRRLTRHETTHLAFQVGRITARVEDHKAGLRRIIPPALASLRGALKGLFEAGASSAAASGTRLHPKEGARHPSGCKRPEARLASRK